jgi:hypothetical protein
MLAASNDIALVGAVLSETIKRALSLRSRLDGACQWLTQRYRLKSRERADAGFPLTRCIRNTRADFALRQTGFSTATKMAMRERRAA